LNAGGVRCAKGAPRELEEAALTPQQRRNRRRAAIAATLVAAALGVAVFTQRSTPRPRAVTPPASPADSVALDIEDLRAGRGMKLSTDPPPLPPYTETPLQLRVEPSPPPLPDPRGSAPQAESPAPAADSPSPSEPLQVASGSGAAGAAGAATGLDGPVDEFLKMVKFRPANVSQGLEKLLRKRRIKASVIVQMRVGTDGRVAAVRVLREIPDCDECNQSAVEAAWQVVYETPPAPVWAAPVDYEFSYR
jgi:hypothetical protein